MNYQKRLDRAFQNAPTLPITPYTRYVFFSDCHRGIDNANDNFLKNENCYLAALQYYYQYGFCYVEVGDGDELWENRDMLQIKESHADVFSQLRAFRKKNGIYMLYGNHDMVKKKWNAGNCGFSFYEGLILHSTQLPRNLYVTHGHQADLLNSTLWKLSRFLVRYLWTPLEALGIKNPTSASKNDTKKENLERCYLNYAISNNRLFLAGHTHRPVLGNSQSPYYNCGSCVHPGGITCIELDGYHIRLVKWYISAEKNEHFDIIYAKCPPMFPLYIKREVVATENLL